MLLSSLGFEQICEASMFYLKGDTMISTLMWNSYPESSTEPLALIAKRPRNYSYFEKPFFKISFLYNYAFDFF